MDHFNYQSGQLMAEDVSLAKLAEQYGTPLFVYSKATLVRHLKPIRIHWPTTPPGLLRHEGQLQFGGFTMPAQAGAGFDIVSQGELERVILAGGDQPKSCLAA